MYFIFETKIINWDDESLQAKIVNYTSAHTRLQEKWWYGQKFDTPIPKFVFEINEEAPIPDNYWTGTLFNLYSLRLINIYTELNVQHELFLAKIISMQTKKPLSLEYGVFRLMEIDDVIDLEKSIFVNTMIGGHSVSRLKRLVLLKGFSRQSKPITRIRNYENITIVHEDFKQILEQINISGCNFIPLYENRHEFEMLLE